MKDYIYFFDDEIIDEEKELKLTKKMNEEDWHEWLTDEMAEVEYLCNFFDY